MSGPSWASGPVPPATSAPTHRRRRPFGRTTRIFRAVIVVQVLLLAGALAWGSYDANENYREWGRPSQAERNEETKRQQAAEARRDAIVGAFLPVCSGIGAPTAGERGPAGTPRRPWFVTMPAGTSAQQVAEADTAGSFDTVVCLTSRPGTPHTCRYNATVNGGPVNYQAFPLEVHVAAKDARSALEIGARGVHFDAPPCEHTIHTGTPGNRSANIDTATIRQLIEPLLAI